MTDQPRKRDTDAAADRLTDGARFFREDVRAILDERSRLLRAVDVLSAIVNDADDGNRTGEYAVIDEALMDEAVSALAALDDGDGE